MRLSEKKVKTAFFCARCGAEHPKWQGQCRECAAWNSLIEERLPSRPSAARVDTVATKTRMNDIEEEQSVGYCSGIEEFDRVVGGQLLPGMTVLLGGEPGIGKSTLLLQLADAYSRQGLSVLYITGEESLPQIKRRANRLGVAGDRIDVVNETSLEAMLPLIEKDHFAVVLVDSVQTVSSGQFDSPPGTVAQVREAAHALISEAKARGFALFLVGHVTKEGLVAGPKVLEHMVDTVVYFEGDSAHLYRLLRPVKNRFGSVAEIGLFEMSSAGLVEVADAASLFLSDHISPGTVTGALCEGNRVMMVDVQALVTAASYGTPQRVAGGIDNRKLALLLAILEKRCDYPMATNDVFVSLAGGLRLAEPALDLPTVLAIVSSLLGKPVDRKTLVVGEVGLSGEIRAVANADRRAAEAAKLGFTKMVIPQSNLSQVVHKGMKLVDVTDIQSALDVAFG